MKETKKVWIAVLGVCIVAGIGSLVALSGRSGKEAKASVDGAVFTDNGLELTGEASADNGLAMADTASADNGLISADNGLISTDNGLASADDSLTLAGTETAAISTPIPTFEQKDGESKQELMEITAERFGNPFYLYVREKFDTDGDGMLSVEEREAVTEIDYVSENYFSPQDLEKEGNAGLNALVKITGCFPKLEKIRVDYAEDVLISGLMHLKYFELRAEEENGERNSYIVAEGVRRIKISHCPALEEIRCQNYLNGELLVSECIGLTTYTEEDGCMARLVFEKGTPKLSACVLERADGTRQETDISHGEAACVVREHGEGEDFAYDGFKITE